MSQVAREHSSAQENVGDSLEAYLHRTREYSLLSAADEVALAQAIEAGQLANELLLGEEDEILRVKNMSVERQQNEPDLRADLMEVVLAGQAAKRQMIESNLRLVIKLARAKHNEVPHIPLLDLIQQGNLGLEHAVVKFDYTLGYKFSTYATKWIRRDISMGVYGTEEIAGGRTIRLPREVDGKIRDMHRAEDEYCQAHGGKAPSDGSLAEEIKVTPEKLRTLRENDYDIVSLNQSVGGDEDTELGALQSDETLVGVEQQVEKTLMVEGVWRCLDQLGGEERRALVKLYGLDGQGSRTQVETATELGWGRGKVQERCRSAVRRLRLLAYQDRLDEFLHD